jgi:hypothetical protein
MIRGITSNLVCTTASLMKSSKSSLNLPQFCPLLFQTEIQSQPDGFDKPEVTCLREKKLLLAAPSITEPNDRGLVSEFKRNEA